MSSILTSGTSLRSLRELRLGKPVFAAQRRRLPRRAPDQVPREAGPRDFTLGEHDRRYSLGSVAAPFSRCHLVASLLGRSTITALRDYVERNAIALPADFNGCLADFSCLSAFDKSVSEADVVVLGELNHFVHEKADFRQFLSRYLVSRGVRTFAEELGWSDGVRVERFLRGDEQALTRLPSFGYTGHLREDRDDRPTGILRASFDAYPTSLFVDEQSRFYRTLRDVAPDGRLNYFGFDIDGLPGGTYEDIEETLSDFRRSPAISDFRSSLTRMRGERPTEEAERLTLSRALLDNCTKDADPRTVALVKASLDALIDSLRYVAGTYGAKTYEALRPGMALREDAMKRRIEDIETVGSANSKIALMGHALHLVKDDRKLASNPGAVGPGGGLTCSLGHHLAQTKRKRVFSVWFVYGAGEDSQPFPDLPREAHYPSSSINAVLASLGKPLILSTDDPLLRQPVILGHMYNSLVELPLADQADAVFFLPRVTPLRPRE